jgi:non-ribosomal peptide synthase protein (TIGR01720 family)
VLSHLLVQHDALRHRFRRDGSVWRQTIAAPGEQASVVAHNLARLTSAEQVAEIERIGSDLQASLNLAEGPLLRAALFQRGRGRSNRLLIVVHHLVIDGVSWRILLEDFATAYEQLENRQEVRLPAKTSSFQRWAERLREYAQSAAVAEELGYWQERLQRPVARLPRDSEGENTVASTGSVVVKLEEAETRELLQEVPKAFHTQIHEVLLTAVAQALARWTGKRHLRIDVEGHGREGLFEDLDVTRTVGWFTAIYPVMVELGEGGDLGEEVQRVKEQLRRVPQGGLGYGLLRYARGEPEIVERLEGAEVVFNYLGQFAAGGTEPGEWRTATERIGPACHPRGMRPYLIEINGSVEEGRLEMEWSYSQAVHQRATIERLASNFRNALASLVGHCRSSEAVRYSPSDFSKAKLSQRDLDRLLARLHVNR